MTFTPGFYPTLSSEAYHADPCPPSLSKGIAQLLIDKSPLHAWHAHPKLGNGAERDETKAMALGSLVHAMLLGQGPTFAVGQWDDWRTKDAREFRDGARADGKIPLLQKDFDRCAEVSLALAERIGETEMGPHFLEGQKELTAIWQDGETWLRCRFDCLSMSEDAAVILDLKTSTDSSPEVLGKKCSSLGYDLQAAWYTAGVEALRPDLAGRVPFVFLFVEVEKPYAVSLVQLDEAGVTLGRHKMQRALAIWRRCLAQNDWPGYSKSVTQIQLPSWALQGMYLDEVGGFGLD